MEYEQSLIECRPHRRANTRGAVIPRGSGREIPGRGVVVNDTSLEVSCQLGFMLLEMAGTSVEIEMRLDGAASTWFVAHGQVARVRAAKHSLVIALSALPDALAALLAAEPETRVFHRSK